MEISVLQDLRDGVATLTLCAPPVNALGTVLRSLLSQRLAALSAEPGVRAIILRAEGRLFCAGADIREFAAPAHTSAPALADLCQQIETQPQPVITALHGAALGGGAELALAAHFRLALSTATIGLPEVTLGLIPGAGGTQRLPRLVGAKAALAMMLDGRPIPADRAGALGLVDGIIPAGAPGDQARDLAAAAQAFAVALINRGMGPRPTSARHDHLADGAAWLAAVGQARSGVDTATAFAPRQIVACVEAAVLLPLAAGLAFERAAFDACLTHPQSVALRHLFLAERRVPAALMVAPDGGPRALSAAGTALAACLARAQLGAAEALIRLGVDVSAIDDALAELGTGSDRVAALPGQAGLDPLARRINAAVMAEGCRLVNTGLVRTASDVDVLAVLGLGYPRLSGGPMKAAEIAGLTHLRADMLLWSADDPLWAVPQLLTQAVKFAGGFAALSPG